MIIMDPPKSNLRNLNFNIHRKGKKLNLMSNQHAIARHRYLEAEKKTEINRCSSVCFKAAMDKGRTHNMVQRQEIDPSNNIMAGLCRQNHNRG